MTTPLHHKIVDLERVESDVEDLLLLGRTDNRLELLPLDFELGSVAEKIVGTGPDNRFFTVSSEIAWVRSHRWAPRQ